LDDGALLSVPYDPQATLPLPAARDTDPPRTEILPSQWKPVRSNITAPPAAAYTAKAGPAQATSKKGSHWIIVTGTLGLITAGLLIVVGYMAWKMTSKPTETAVVSAVPATNSNIHVDANSNVNAIANKETSAKPAVANDSNWLNGTWEGRGYQSNTKTTWTIKLTVQNGLYQIDYPSIPCGGRWTLVQNNSTQARFQERITQGTTRCEISTNVAIEKIDDSHLSCRYSSTRTRTVIATATLTRKAQSSDKL